jgi:hypothetical protein
MFGWGMDGWMDGCWVEAGTGNRGGRLTTRLSHMPVAIFASVFEEQGAMRTISAQRRSSMCNIGSPMR